MSQLRTGSFKSGNRRIGQLARLYGTRRVRPKREDDATIYGTGVVSSCGEIQFALDDVSPNRIAFDFKRAMRTHYRIDDYQQNYFVIPSFG